MILFKTRQISVFGIVSRHLFVLILYRMQQSYIIDFLDKYNNVRFKVFFFVPSSFQFMMQTNCTFTSF